MYSYKNITFQIKEAIIQLTQLKLIWRQKIIKFVYGHLKFLAKLHSLTNILNYSNFEIYLMTVCPEKTHILRYNTHVYIF